MHLFLKCRPHLPRFCHCRSVSGLRTPRYRNDEINRQPLAGTSASFLLSLLGFLAWFLQESTGLIFGLWFVTSGFCKATATNLKSSQNRGTLGLEDERVCLRSKWFKRCVQPKSALDGHGGCSDNWWSFFWCLLWPWAWTAQWLKSTADPQSLTCFEWNSLVRCFWLQKQAKQIGVLKDLGNSVHLSPTASFWSFW